MMILIQRFFDNLGTGGIMLVLLISLVSLLFVGVSHYRRSVEVCRPTFHEGSVSWVLKLLLL